MSLSSARQKKKSGLIPYIGDPITFLTINLVNMIFLFKVAEKKIVSITHYMLLLSSETLGSSDYSQQLTFKVQQNLILFNKTSSQVS